MVAGVIPLILDEIIPDFSFSMPPDRIIGWFKELFGDEDMIQRVFHIVVFVCVKDIPEGPQLL